MDKTARTELHRTFLIERLPDPLTRASAHIQLFDNYVADTRIRLRSLRDPESRTWTHILQQRTHADAAVYRTKLSEMYLNEQEYGRFQIFEGSEIRKNRYFHEFDGRMAGFDVYMGGLWGLNTARVEFEDEAGLLSYEPPPFAVFDVSNDAFFLGENLVTKTFADIQAEVARLGEPALMKPAVQD